MRTAFLALLLLATVARAVEAPPSLPKPSANAGKVGTYEVACGVPGYTYFVCAPERPADGRAYGLHLFFHGQHGNGGASYFGSWEPVLLRPFGLIGINMYYADGDNLRDTAGKVAVAKAAVLQVMADYPVAPGRGMIACFSGGGLPCGQWYSANGTTRGLSWPFSSLALYGANFLASVQKGPTTAWFVWLAKDEWALGQPNLGSTQNRRFAEALGLIDQLGWDQCMRIVEGGHGVHEPEVATAARLFARNDAFNAPFLYLPEWSERPLAAAAALANAGQLGAADQALGKIKDAKIPADRIEALRKAIDARAAIQLALLTDLADQDPRLATFYAPLARTALKDHPKGGDLKPLLERIAKDRAKVAAADAAVRAVAKIWPSVFPGRAAVNAKSAPVLEQALAALGATSDLGLLMQETLALPQVDGK
jgi:hypothetical protein